MEMDCFGEMVTTTARANDNNNNNNSSSRWNPTKEQINMLENLYREGVRTPSAEQIQEITGRLKAYGHIEGKNVFYWFQNHKARQRQKQKQESFAYYLNRYVHHSAVAAAPAVVVYPSLQPNGFYGGGAYLIGEGELGGMGILYPKPKVVVPTPYKRKVVRRERVIEKKSLSSFTVPAHHDHHLIINYSTSSCTTMPTTVTNIQHYSTSDQTLDLFPLHPTGIDLDVQVPSSAADHNSSTTATETSSLPGFHHRSPFIDFFN